MKCSFCNLDIKGKYIIKAPIANICEACVALCVIILKEKINIDELIKKVNVKIKEK